MKPNSLNIIKKTVVVIIAIFCIFLISCNETNKKINIKSENSEYIKIYLTKDTSKYLTSVIESHNPETPNVLVVNFKIKMLNITGVPPFPKNPITLNHIEIIENPNEESAEYSIDYNGNLNGLYDSLNYKLKLPIKLFPYNSFYCVLKHGQTIDNETLEFLKSNFKDLKNLNSKEVFDAILLNGLNLVNDKSITEQVFQLKFYSERNTVFSKDVVFQYNNYCK